jgi:uncharacterized protein (DUF1697 family)
MKTFIALLRGINVSGQKKIKMSDLKILFETLSFAKVQTYIQSGNVIFDSHLTDLKSLKEKIEGKIKQKSGFDVEVIVKTPDELEHILKKNPFLKRSNKNPDRLYVTFLADASTADSTTKLKEVNYLPEEYFIDGSTVYLFLPNGNGRAKLNNNFWEKNLKVQATTRNWNTVNMLVELSKSRHK